jgi:hypothetical protein
MPLKILVLLTCPSYFFIFLFQKHSAIPLSIQLSVSPADLIELAGNAEVFTELIIPMYAFLYPIEYSSHNVIPLEEKNH